MPNNPVTNQKGVEPNTSQEAWFNLVGYCKALVELDRQAKEPETIYNNEAKEMSNEEYERLLTQGKPKSINIEGV